VNIPAHLQPNLPNPFAAPPRKKSTDKKKAASLKSSSDIASDMARLQNEIDALKAKIESKS